ncbi:hypothetical protein GCM10017776_56060 [Streptomyces griseoluteus]|nr:hypothetical protein GCM10017776_56060 [Streptomyces griseoluteus]
MPGRGTWASAPAATRARSTILRRQLRATRPQWSCTHLTRGFLPRVDLATPKRAPTLAHQWALRSGDGRPADLPRVPQALRLLSSAAHPGPLRPAVRTAACTEPDRPKDLRIRYVTVGGSFVDVTGG